MKGFQEEEKQIKLKMAGMNLRSYLDIAQKQPSSAIIIEQDELELDHNITKLKALQQAQLQNRSFQKQPQSDSFIQKYKSSRADTLYYMSEQNKDQSLNINCSREESQVKQFKFQEALLNTSEGQVCHKLNQKSVSQTKNFNLTQSNSPIQLLKKKKQLAASKKHKKSAITKVIQSEYILLKIKPFLLSFLAKFTFLARQRFIKDQSRTLIGDLSDKFTYSHKKNLLSQILNLFLLFLQNLERLIIIIFFQNIPLFNPENKYRILVNALIVCYNCFYLFIISLTLFFKAQIQDYQHLFHYIAIAAWIFEMVLQMNTSTYHEGDFITDRKTLFRIYVKEYFFFEVLPLVFEGKTSSNPTINILLHLPLLLKLKGMSIILSKLEFLILQHLHTPYVMQICKQLLSILLLVHLMACSYATLAFFERNILLNQENWIDLGNIQNASYCWWTTYIEAQLWAFYTLSSSYSSSVFSKYEYLFTSFWMLISYVVFAYNIIALGKIFQDINSAKENYEKDLNLLNRYMKRKKIDLYLNQFILKIQINNYFFQINRELQRAINSHIVKQYDQEVSTQFEAEKDALKKLSPHMRNKLIIESNKRIISQFSIFNNLSQQTQYKLYQIMEEECYSEGQNVQIFDKNTQECFIYLIFSGKIEILQQLDGNQQNLSGQNCQAKYLNLQDKDSTIQKCEKFVCYLKEGHLLGEYEFFSNISFPYIIRCQQKTVLVKISNLKFQQIIQQNQADLQKVMELKQKIAFNKEIELLKSQCLICEEIDHHFMCCPQTHLFKSVYFVATKSNISKPQERHFRQRRVKKYQRLVISMPSQQVISTDEDEDNQQEAGPQQSQLCPAIEEETSILEQTNKFNSNKINSSKSKFNKEEARSEHSDSQDQDTQIIQADKVYEQAKNAPSSIGNQRQNYKTRISLLKQQRKSIERLEDFTSNQDKMDWIQKKSMNEEKSQTLNIDERIINMSTSQKNLTEFSQSSILQPSNSLKRDKSLSSVASQQIIKKQSQFQHLSQLESVQEINSHHIIQDKNNKYEHSYDNILIRNSLVPFNTIQSGRLSLNKNHEQCCSQQKINIQFSKKPWNGSSLYWEFDKMSTFIYFFPQFNYRNLSGQNRRSYLDITQKLPSSTLVVDQDDQESKINQSRLPTQLKMQVQAISRQPQQQSDLSLFADKSVISKISISHLMEGKNDNQWQKSSEEKQQFVKFSEIYENQANRSWQSPYQRNQNKQVDQKQLKTLKSAQQKKHSFHIKKIEKKSLLTSAQKSEYLHLKMKPNITDFINKFTLFGKYKQMKEKSRWLLGDLSDKCTYMPQNKKYSTIQNILWMFLQFLKKLEKFVILIFENLPLFNPENKLRICVNGLIACYNCFYLFTISLTLFFKAEFQEYQHLFHYIAIAAWIFEMILQMNTATYHEGDFITDRKTIFRIYVKEYFFFEVLPLIFEGKTSSNAAINILLHLPLLLKLKGM
ncbi:hypothetical protein ABPG72_014454 [Tetrahymena utriculariae]